MSKRAQDPYIQYVFGGIVVGLFAGGMVGAFVGHTGLGWALGAGAGLVISMVVYSFTAEPKEK